MEQNKNVHKTHKRCKIFVKRLASKFKKDLPASRLKNSHLKSAFKDTIDSLPEERKELFTNYDKYAKLLIKYCDSNKEETNEAVCSYSNIEFPYNLYLKNGHVINDKLPESEKSVLCSHVFAKELERDWVWRGSKKVFKKLEEEAQSLSGNCSEVDNGLRMIRICTCIKNPQVVLIVMKMCLSKFQSCSEDCISKGKPKKARSLSEKVQEFLKICHVRYHNMQQMSHKKGPYFEDLMAAYISIYIDLCLVVANKEENRSDLSNRICSFTVYLLSRWPHHMLDVLLQLTALDSDNADIVQPLIRKAFQHKPEANDNKQYLKYVLTVRTLTQKLDSEMEEIKQETLGLKAPKSFLSWLQEEKSETLEEMPEDRKFKGRQITRFMLEDMSEELESQLMDLLTDNSSLDINEEEVEEIDNQEVTIKSKQKSEESNHAHTGPSLFYFDTKGIETADHQTGQVLEEIVILDDDDDDYDDDDDDDKVLIQEEEITGSKENGLMVGDFNSEDEEDITETFFIDKKSKDDIEMIGDSDTEVTTVVQDTINKVQEMLENAYMTRHAKKLFESSHMDSKLENFKSSTRSKEVKSPLNNKHMLNDKNLLVDSEQITEIVSAKLSQKKSQIKSKDQTIDRFPINKLSPKKLPLKSDDIIPDSDIEEEGDNLECDFVPEISSHLKQTPNGKKLTNSINNDQKTPVSRWTQKNDYNFDQSNDEKEDCVDLMSPVISQVKVQPSRKMIQSMKTGLARTTRLRTQSLTETEPDKLGSVKKASMTGCKPVVMVESLQMEPKEDIKMTNLSKNYVDTVGEHDVIVGGYSLRQTRKRTLSETSNSSAIRPQSVTEKPVKIEKSVGLVKTPKPNSITRIDNVVLIEMSDSEASSSPKKKSTNTAKTVKTRIGDIDVTEMSDSEGLSIEDEVEDTNGKTLFKVDKEITFTLDKTVKKKSSRRKSEPGNRKLTAIKVLKSTKSRRYSLRHK